MNLRRLHPAITVILPLTLLLILAKACSVKKEETSKLQPDENNAGITLPEGFGAMVIADNLGRARHFAVNSNGDVYCNAGKIPC